MGDTTAVADSTASLFVRIVCGERVGAGGGASRDDEYIRTAEPWNVWRVTNSTRCVVVGAADMRPVTVDTIPGPSARNQTMGCVDRGRNCLPGRNMSRYPPPCGCMTPLLRPWTATPRWEPLRVRTLSATALVVILVSAPESTRKG